MSSSVATYLVRKYGTRNADVIKDFGLKGVWAEAIAKGLLNVAWNWHVYGPKGTHPSEAMTKHTRKQAVENLAVGMHQLIDALDKEIKETP